MTAEALREPMPLNGHFTDRSILSVEQFNPLAVTRVFDEADAMAAMVHQQGRSDLLADTVVANLFYEPSTRTFLSFEAAAVRLGAGTIATQGVEFSSIAKGETLEDTIRTVASYADIIDLRHSETGAAERAANVSRVPVINGGDGSGEHPTQALLDLYTIKHKLGRVDDLRVTMVGDLKHGRTVNSLARLLALFSGNSINYVSPREYDMPEDTIAALAAAGVAQQKHRDLKPVIEETDVLYVTRVQSERIGDKSAKLMKKEPYVINAALLEQARDNDMIVMHPLPRVNEIHPEVDSDPRVVFFDQVESGLYVRMALLAMVAGRSVVHGGREAPMRSTMKPWMTTS